MVMLFTWQSIICKWNQGQSAWVDLCCFPRRLDRRHHSLLGMSGVIWAQGEDYNAFDWAPCLVGAHRRCALTTFEEPRCRALNCFCLLVKVSRIFSECKKCDFRGEKKDKSKIVFSSVLEIESKQRCITQHCKEWIVLRCCESLVHSVPRCIVCLKFFPEIWIKSL